MCEDFDFGVRFVVVYFVLLDDEVLIGVVVLSYVGFVCVVIEVGVFIGCVDVGWGVDGLFVCRYFLCEDFLFGL